MACSSHALSGAATALVAGHSYMALLLEAKEVQLFSATGSELVLTSCIGGLGIATVAFSPTGRYLAALSLGELHVISAISGLVLGSRILPEGDKDFQTFAWHPAGLGLTASTAAFHELRPQREESQGTTAQLLHVRF